MKNEAPYVDIERSIIKQFRKEIWRPFVRGLQEYKMIRDGDKVAVCISGGKDSMLLAKCLQQLKRQSSTEFGLEFIVMDPGYHPDNRKLIEDNAAIRLHWAIILMTPLKPYSWAFSTEDR